MKKIALSENGVRTGRFFDMDKATKYEEGTFHEALYKTASGKWVLNCYSQMYEIISPVSAARWFVKNEYEAIPDELANEIADLEV